jgi:hypothetical protein
MTVFNRLLNGLAIAAIPFALAGAMVFATSNLASAQDGNCDGNCQGGHRDTRGAPGPFAAAGLPFLAVGYGVYWLIRRRRKPE